MSGRIFQSVIVQMKEATDRVIGVIDSEGNVVACNELAMVGTHLGRAASAIADAKEQTVVCDARTFKLLGGWNADYDYAVFVEGADEQARCICVLASIAFSEAKTHYEEKYDKTTFIKNIISDNTLLADLYIRAKELHIDVHAPRAVFLVRQKEKIEVSTIEVMQNLFPDRQKDFVFGVSETDVVLIKELPLGADSKEISRIASQIETTLNTELFLKSVIGVGSVARHLRELAERYKEAMVAIEVGKVFENDKMIVHYDNLGIGRLIYQLPTTLCEMFLNEVFKKNSIDSLDQETLYTINKFFENNLNVSETSRKLFVHRNTLVYRLEKIKKLTGLDLREFDHAIVFKVALMVKKYLSSRDDDFVS
ncbi:MAG: helix-turn-helix domain-containing protein [Oscillospiraceae bacterium]|nr:helix-turn-helix domain-containing protein [Oscillospiraceae bacterium]